jgi:rRNA maturation endonuclease Nob1
MTCSRCKKSFDDQEARCPNCGEPSDSSGLFQTSTVLISTGGSDLVYRSVDEVPDRLRTKLLKSTNGANSATILIADRRGRKEVAKAMRSLPGPAQRRLIQSILGSAAAADALTWLTTARRRAIMVVIAVLTLATVAIVFTHTWR